MYKHEKIYYNLIRNPFVFWKDYEGACFVPLGRLSGRRNGVYK